MKNISTTDTCGKCNTTIQKVDIALDKDYEYGGWRWICNICRRNFDRQFQPYHCFPCNFDVCDSCHSQRTLGNLTYGNNGWQVTSKPIPCGKCKKDITKVSVTTDPDYASSGYNWSCDLCRNTFDKNVFPYHCFPCNYDVCDACHDKITPPNPNPDPVITLFGPEHFLDNNKQFYIKSALGNAYLHVFGGQAFDGANLTTWELVDQANLKWTLSTAQNGFYINSVVNPNFVIHLHGGGSNNGDKCTLWNKTTHGQQDNLKVKFEKTRDNFWLIRFNNSGKYAHVHGGSTANGTQISQWDFVDQANLKWELVPVNKSEFGGSTGPIETRFNVGVSTFNPFYYCSITKIEFFTDNFKIYIEVHGNGSLGPLQNAVGSTLTCGNATLQLQQFTATVNNAFNINGFFTVPMNQVTAGQAFTFRFGQQGYSVVNCGVIPTTNNNNNNNTNQGGSKQVWDLVRQKLVPLIHPSGNFKFGPRFVRLAFHDAGTYNKSINKGGGATVQFMLDLPQNGGLADPINVLKDIRNQVGGQVSLADLIIFACIVSIQTLGGPTIPFRPGRRDLTQQDANDILNAHPDKNFILPKPNRQDSIRQFYEKYGFGDREIVLFNGAHTLGATIIPDNVLRSWSRNPQRFDNDYYVRLYTESWPRFDFPGQSGKSFWKTPDNALILFETDFILLTDQKFRAIGQEYLNNNDRFFRDFSAMFQSFSEKGWTNLGPVIQ